MLLVEFTIAIQVIQNDRSQLNLRGYGHVDAHSRFIP